ncbi:hypothetical protein SLEP1_g27899 [Rubroshorea leprosula]|uniref:Bidirectional sugar transporter SWEET n=1 Tax=Rubroshorea leprosula TaxID=152421 RepID=A0AAV5K184_9ROSI|nr:hypothetical protein SLEP1_g27899 [Rubroshorea leprosula]
MALISTQNPWLFVFGLLGNISSFVVFLAPLSTFYRIWKKKSTEGFHSVPYLTGLFSAMLWIYYALLKADAFLLITINAFGCVIETIYIAFYITYAPRKARIPNILGVIFGLLQMVLYAVYRNKSKMVVAAQSQSPQHSIDITKLKTQLPNCDKNIENEVQKENDHQNIDQTGNTMEVFNSNPKMASEV